MHLQRGKLDDVRLRPLTRALYHVLIEHGAFHGEHVELLHGVLVTMSPQGTRHSYPVMQLNEILLPALKGRARIRVQLPFAASDESEPEPDFAIVPLGDYLDDHPDRAYLLVEVSDSSLRFDREKATLYAASPVQEYWIVDVQGGTITVYADASNGAWQTMTTHGRDELLSIPGFADVTLVVGDIVPPVR